MNNARQCLEHPLYAIDDVSAIASPSLLIYLDVVKANLTEMISIAGGPEQLCPHCKTHKTPQITKLMLEMGITHHKCATIAEAEMLAAAGVQDVLIAYQLVGPNVERLIRLIERFPETRFVSLIDHPTAIMELSRALATSEKECGVLIDLETGMKRTGIEIGDTAIELIEMAVADENIVFEGLHWYDGHHRQSDLGERQGLTLAAWQRLQRFRDQLTLHGIAVKRIVAGGIGSFSILAQTGEANLQLSPGTTTFFDAEMAERFPEMKFRPAAAILTRVISCNRRGHLTLDVGHKACAADVPAGQRLSFVQLPDAREILHSEEHCVVATESAEQFPLGSPLIAISRHACSTSAAYDDANVISGGKVVDRWAIAARGRSLTI